METLLKSGMRVWRNFAGKDTAVKRFLKHQYKKIKSWSEEKYFGENFVIFWSGAHSGNHVGIYLKGSCDLVSIFSCQPLIQHVLNGTCCIIREGLASDSRSDLILQTLQNIPQTWLDPVIDRLKLSPDYFTPLLFERNFIVDRIHRPMEFPKKVIFISIGPDIIRTLYKHRKHGFLVDPGGWWLNRSLDTVLADLSAVTWFKQTFTRIGKMSVNNFQENLAKIIKLLKKNTDAHIIVFNALTVEPNTLTHNYQFVKNSLSMRCREFNLALVELSRKLDFSILDVDRILKRAGTRCQMDVGHFPPEIYQPIAQEAFRMMRDLDIF